MTSPRRQNGWKPKEDRKSVLLRAAYDLLTKCDRSPIVLEANAVTVFYDEAECDGNCLREDIATELGINDDPDPLAET